MKSFAGSRGRFFKRAPWPPEAYIGGGFKERRGNLVNWKADFQFSKLFTGKC
jgi:hypothetical protein